jgi:two-component system phosphate regulon response regulator PhoB
MKTAHTVILIVEDDPAVAELVKYSLRGGDWLCRSVSTLEQAWEFIESHRPQLVLLDWMLRQENGLRLLARIRRDPALYDLPVMLLTARTLPEDQQLGLDSGADDYLTKPFSPADLCARATALLNTKTG